MTKLIHALNTASGQVGVVPANYLNIPGVKDYLVEVPEGTKSYEASKFKPQTAEEYLADRKKPAAPKDADPKTPSDD